MKQLLIFLALIPTLFAVETTQVVSIEGDRITVEKDADLSAGESAFVIRTFDPEHETIIAECIVSDDEITLECRDFDYLPHDSLSLVKTKIAIGDTVRVGLLSQTKTIIAPDQASYLEARRLFPDTFWLHPDILAVDLAREGNPAPKAESFQTFCRSNIVGALLFVLEDGVYEVDCMSMTTLQRLPGEYTADEPVRPFYHRVGEIERGLFDFSSEQVEDFTRYYKTILGVQ